MDAIEVKPRYVEPIANSVIQNEPAAVVPTVEPSTVKGLFMSMYENKIIVMFIVIVILLIGVIAYIFCRNPDADKVKNTPKESVERLTGSDNQSTAKDQSTTKDQPEPEPEQKAKIDNKKPSKPLDNNSLMELYNRSKNIVQPDKEAPSEVTNHQNQRPAIANSKTDDEISQLMEDEEDEEEKSNQEEDEEKARYDL